MSAYTLTIRHGPRVERERFESLDEAIAGMRHQAEAIRAAGPLDSVKAFREYGPGQRVAGRVELSDGGWLRGRDAGVDVMGDGTLVPYAGGMRKRRLDEASPFDAVRAGDGMNDEIKVFADREEEGVEVGRRVRLPRGAEPPIKVFVNGVEQTRGKDYELRRDQVVFKRSIVKEGKVGGARWAAMYLGLFGTYRKHETIDIEYRLGGQVKLLADAKVVSD